MLFRVNYALLSPSTMLTGLNLSCESNAFQGSMRSGENVDVAIGLNLSCESNAFQG